LLESSSIINESLVLSNYSECEINLNDRIDYLARARLALQSTSNKTYNEEENELKDKLDVATVQEKIFKQLLRKEDVEKEREKQKELKRLNSQLLDITAVRVYI
jgi:pyruvate/2-oxoacid:ferredoxin oxidoreductase beta subunit